MPTTLILIRHGHTAGNDIGLDRPMSGWADLPLSALGRRQALALRRRLSRCPPAAAIYASHLQRARETAALLAGCAVGPLRVRGDLGEIRCGDADGLPIREVQARWPDFWAANLQQDDEQFRWPGGESYREMRARCLAAAREIAAAHPGQRVLVVTHAGVVSQIVGAIAGEHAARWGLYRPSNGSITSVAWERDAGVVLRFDDVEHLAALEAELAERDVSGGARRRAG